MNNQKLSSGKLLIFTRYYLPGYKAGGPVRSIKNIVESLGSNFDISVFTGDRDLLDTMPYENVELDNWVSRKHKIYYSSRTRSIRLYSKIIRSTDIVYINSFFDSYFSILPLILTIFLNKKVILAPRGEFSESALNIKPLKKRLYISFFKFFGFKNKISWHATNQEEYNRIEKVVGKGINGYVINNFSSSSNENMSAKSKKSYIDLFFLARISKMKNLKFAIRTLAEVKYKTVFTVYGPIDDSQYWQDCQDEISKLPEHIKVNYLGSVNHSQVPAIIREHNFLFLPTLGENFGHTIVECLADGTPVIISDNTPWNELQEAGAGWNCSLNDGNSFVSTIESLAQLSDSDYMKLRMNTAKYYNLKVFDQQENLQEDYLKLFVK